jgi:hypothetical protein
MYYSQFRTKNCIDATLDNNYFNKSIANLAYTNFMGLMIDDTPTWVDHIDQLISRLNSTCCTIRAVRARFTRKALRMLYFPYVHSIISYGIIFLSSTHNGIKILGTQKKKKIRIITNAKKIN